jgi:PAS domain S-box-containing protein
MEITKVRSPLYAAFEQVTVHCRRARIALSRLGKIAADRHRRLRETLRARELEMHELLASSLDAIIVAGADHRFVAANSKARELFGISEANLRKFNVEAFLPPGQIPALDEDASPFLRKRERRGTCEVRRLDGGVCVAEYSVIPNFLRRSHLCRFSNIVKVQVDVSRSTSLMAQIVNPTTRKFR